jgi:hypothetical protein
MMSDSLADLQSFELKALVAAHGEDLASIAMQPPRCFTDDIVSEIRSTLNRLDQLCKELERRDSKVMT